MDPRDPNELEVCGTREALAILGARKSAAMGRLRKTRLTEQCKEKTMGWWLNWYFRFFKYLIIFYLIYQGLNYHGQIWLSHCQIAIVSLHPRWILACVLVSCQSYPEPCYLLPGFVRKAYWVCSIKNNKGTMTRTTRGITIGIAYTFQ